MSLLSFAAQTAMEYVRSHVLGSNSPSNLSMQVGLNVDGHKMPRSQLEKAEKPSRSPMKLSSRSTSVGGDR